MTGFRMWLPKTTRLWIYFGKYLAFAVWLVALVFAAPGFCSEMSYLNADLSTLGSDFQAIALPDVQAWTKGEQFLPDLRHYHEPVLSEWLESTYHSPNFDKELNSLVGRVNSSDGLRRLNDQSLKEYIACNNAQSLHCDVLLSRLFGIALVSRWAVFQFHDESARQVGLVALNNLRSARMEVSQHLLVQTLILDLNWSAINLIDFLIYFGEAAPIILRPWDRFILDPKVKLGPLSLSNRFWIETQIVEQALTHMDESVYPDFPDESAKRALLLMPLMEKHFTGERAQTRERFGPVELYSALSVLQRHFELEADFVSLAAVDVERGWLRATSSALTPNPIERFALKCWGMFTAFNTSMLYPTFFLFLLLGFTWVYVDLHINWAGRYDVAKDSVVHNVILLITNRGKDKLGSALCRSKIEILWTVYIPIYITFLTAHLLAWR